MLLCIAVFSLWAFKSRQKKTKKNILKIKCGTYICLGGNFRREESLTLYI